jgi:hypothetical protein
VIQLSLADLLGGFFDGGERLDDEVVSFAARAPMHMHIAQPPPPRTMSATTTMSAIIAPLMPPFCGGGPGGGGIPIPGGG